MRAALSIAALLFAATVTSSAAADEAAAAPPAPAPSEPKAPEKGIELKVSSPSAEPVPNVAPRPTKEPIGTQRFLGAIAGATGFLTVAIGSFLVISSANLYDEAKSRCGGSCGADEVDDANKARSRANGGGIVLVSGLALLGGGIALYLTAPPNKSDTPKEGVQVGITTSLGGLRAVGTF